MKKTIQNLIGLIIAVATLSACATGIVPVKTLSPPLNELSDPVSVVDVDGHQHIVGVYNDRIYYVETLLNNQVRTKAFQQNTGWIQKSPDIAVQDNKKLWFVWIEENSTTHELKACQFPLAEGSIATIGCVPIAASTHTNGLIRVVSRGNTAYAVWDVPAPQSALRYRVLGSVVEGTVAWYNWGGGEQGIIDYLDLAIDANQKLHIVWVDHTSASSYITKYNSNVVTGDFNAMQQLAMLSSSSDSPETSPQLSFHKFSLVENVVIGEIKWSDRIYFYWLPTTGWVDSSDIGFTWKQFPAGWELQDIDVLGYSPSGDPDVGIIAIPDGETYPQVYTWNYPFTAGGYQALTSSSTEKIDLHMVHGTASYPVIGWMEYVIVQTSPPVVITFESSAAYVYELLDGVRLVNSAFCSPDNGRKAWLTSNLLTNLDYTPVAGVWRQCRETWVGSNAHVAFLPLINK